MIGYFILIAACIHFFIEAKKRGQSSFKWLAIAFGSYMGPQIICVGILVPIMLSVFQMSPEKIDRIRMPIIFLGVGVGFYLLVLSRKKLYRFARLVEDKDVKIITSLEIIGNSDGTFSVADRSFKSRRDAEDYVSLLKRTANKI